MKTVVLPYLSCRVSFILGWFLLPIVAGFGQSRTIHYTYDSAHRLTAVVYDQQSALHYEYDSSGNRTNQIVVGQSNRVADYNGDGMPDLWELIYFGTLEVDPLADPNHDGTNNLAESLAWAVTNASQPALRVTSATKDSSACTLQWNGQANGSYRVWWTDNLNQWDLANSVVVSGASYVDPSPAASQRFYRLSVEP